MNYDVVIIGSGLAGLNSALHAARYGKVLVVTKSQIAESNSHYAQGGIAGVFLPQDNFQKHINDTLEAGAHHNNKKAVEYFVEKAPATIKMLQNLGVKFETSADGKYLLHKEAGHQYQRIVHVGDHTGKSIIDVLVKKIRAVKNITVWEQSFAQKLLVKKNVCYGLQVIHKGKSQNITARRIILASGGAGQLFEYTTNPLVTTGDGIALAARAGCKIKDMEFIQFHPTAFAIGKSPLFLLSETIRGEGAKMLNSKGERFMLHYHKDVELAPRDIVSRAIFEEQKHGPVFLDIRQKSLQELRGNFPMIVAYLQKKGFNLSKDLIPITAAAHYLCGGIVTDVKGKTSIKNLYAIGEVACTGLHGANRLASNSLLEAAVMSEHVMDDALPSFSQGEKLFSKPVEKSKVKPSAATQKKLSRLKDRLQKLMWKQVGIFRTKKMLMDAQKQLKLIEKKLPVQESIQKIELQDMLTTSDIIIKAALKRKKSLGAHFRLN